MSTKKKDGDYGMMHRILKILAWRYATVSELAQILGMSHQAMRYHLSRLMKWGFVVKSSKECIMAVCFDRELNDCIVEKSGKAKMLSCNETGSGRYYVYASSYYIRKWFPSRPAPALWSPPTSIIEIVRKRLGDLNVFESVKGFDFLLMSSVLALMFAVLWNPEPRGDSYWVRLKHLTSRGIKENIPKFLGRYAHMKATKDVRQVTVGDHFEKMKTRYELLIKYSKKYEPSIKKVRWILARMYDYLMVERLGGDRCPYGVWVPHPSLFSLDGYPDFHLPRHHHVRAKHRYKSLGVRRTFTTQDNFDNQDN